MGVVAFIGSEIAPLVAGVNCFLKMFFFGGLFAF
jgi:hypothetical protein